MCYDIVKLNISVCANKIHFLERPLQLVEVINLVLVFVKIFNTYSSLGMFCITWRGSFLLQEVNISK